MSRDPLEAETGAPYSYAGSDPLDNSDPSGMDWCVGPVCVGFHPSDAIKPIVNIGRGASFGLSDKIANWISPGASCTVEQDEFDKLLGSAATTVATLGGGEGWLARLRSGAGEAPKPPGYDPATWTRNGASRITEPGKTWWDPNGGEWRWHAPDKYHPDPHWDHNPWDTWNNPWQHIDP